MFACQDKEYKLRPQRKSHSPGTKKHAHALCVKRTAGRMTSDSCQTLLAKSACLTVSKLSVLRHNIQYLGEQGKKKVYIGNKQIYNT